MSKEFSGIMMSHTPEFDVRATLNVNNGDIPEHVKVYNKAVRPNKDIMNHIIDEVMKLIDTAKKIDKQVQELPPVDEVRDGTKGVEERAKLLVKIKFEEDAAKSHAAAMIKNYKSKLLSDLDSQMRLDDAFANSGYRKLLDDKLLVSVQELEEFAVEHGASLSARRMIERYANEMDGLTATDKAMFAAKDNSENVKDYVAAFLTNAEAVADAPRGYSATWFSFGGKSARDDLAISCGLDTSLIC